MSRPHLQGCSILVVEDEPLITMDISMAFEHTGAHLTTTNTVRHAKVLVEHDGLSAAILDHALSDGECTNLCDRLNERDIPFLMYTGMEKVTEGPCKDAPHLAKPSSHATLLDAMEALIRDHNRRAPERLSGLWEALERRSTPCRDCPSLAPPEIVRTQ